MALLLALRGFTAAPDLALEEAWKSLCTKENPGEAEAAHREVWENLQRIQQHNWEQPQRQLGFCLATNPTGTWYLPRGALLPPRAQSQNGLERTIKVIYSAPSATREFNRLLNGFIPAEQEPVLLFQVSAATKTPAGADWGATGYVTAVKSQVDAEHRSGQGCVMGIGALGSRNRH